MLRAQGISRACISHWGWRCLKWKGCQVTRQCLTWDFSSCLCHAAHHFWAALVPANTLIACLSSLPRWVAEKTLTSQIAPFCMSFAVFYLSAFHISHKEKKICGRLLILIANILISGFREKKQTAEKTLPPNLTHDKPQLGSMLRINKTSVTSQFNWASYQNDNVQSK